MGCRPSHEDFFQAVEQGDEDAVEQMAKYFQDVNFVRTSDRSSPLHIAAFVGYPNILCILLRFGAQIDAVDDEGRTALYAASLAGNLSCVRILIEHEATINLRTHDGRNAFMVAAWRGRLDVLQELASTYAERDVRDQEGKSARDLAFEWNHKSVVAYLDRIADENVDNNAAGDKKIIALTSTDTIIDIG